MGFVLPSLQKRRHLPTLPSLLEEKSIPIIHRDMSWVQFNYRVLDEARQASNNPLLERLKFLGISSSNMDEFFMIRISSFVRKILKPQEFTETKLAQILSVRDSILESVAEFAPKRQEALDQLTASLSEFGIEVIHQLAEFPQYHA